MTRVEAGEQTQPTGYIVSLRCRVHFVNDNNWANEKHEWKGDTAKAAVEEIKLSYFGHIPGLEQA